MRIWIRFLKLIVRLRFSVTTLLENVLCHCVQSPAMDTMVTNDGGPGPGTIHCHNGCLDQGKILWRFNFTMKLSKLGWNCLQVARDLHTIDYWLTGKFCHKIDEILSKIDNFLNNCSIQVNGVTNQLLFILIKDPSVSQETHQECCLLPKHIVVCCPLSDHTWDNKGQQTAIIWILINS